LYNRYHYAFTARPDKIYPNRNWQGAPPECKTLTAVLLNKSDLSLVAFGYDARNKSVTSNNKNDWLYFSAFKMTLHNRQGAARKTVKATNCDFFIETEQLVSIFLGEIKRQAFQCINSNQGNPIEASKVRWVVTVPAIWDHAARQAMTKAAERAGIDPNNLVIALEPESAVLMCLANEDKDSPLNLAGNSFMVVDAGGGTVDITVHRKVGDELVELYPPSGGAWGSTYIDQKFEQLLEEIFGKDHIQEAKHSKYWNQVMDYFENAKTGFNPEDPSLLVAVTAIMPKDAQDQTFQAAIDHYNLKHMTKIELDSGMLQLESAVHVLFTPVITNIIDHVATLLAKLELKDVQYLFLVGGFGECPLLQKEIREKFHGRVKKVVIPPVPSTAVVNGAVRYGLNPLVISTRIMPQSIVLRRCLPWNDKKHSGKTQSIGDNNNRYCSDCLHVMVRGGETIRADHHVTQTHCPVSKQHTSVSLEVFNSSNPGAKFWTDPGVKLIGHLIVEIPDVGAPASERLVDVVMKFGGTVITLTATARKTAKPVSARFNFLLDDDVPMLNNLRI